MEVKVKLYGILRKYGEGKFDRGDNIIIPEKFPLRDLISYLDIPERLGKICLVNGYPQDVEYKLSEGNEVKILTVIGGG
ncbi:MAG: hypothetical protein B1H13_02050 [Desulfobacteraceae bacterium 4484_190.3]|nr:MAG: hypothetical protein B1H13_02050 [Desulfobacteraceae bacterium 4484_190.3]